MSTVEESRLGTHRRLSLSGYNTYLECAQRWQYKYLDRLKRDEGTVPEHWRFGTVIHEGMEAAYLAFVERELHGTLTQVNDVALEAVREAWVTHDMPPHGGELDRALGMILDTLAKLSEHYGDVLGVEHRLKGFTPAGTAFIGFADLLRRAGPTTVEIRDYKIAAKVRSTDELSTDAQGALYGHFILREFPWAESVRFSHLYPNHGAKIVAVELSAEWIAEMVNRFDAVAEMIEADHDLKPRPGEHCGECAYRDVCPAWEHTRESQSIERMAQF